MEGVAHDPLVIKNLLTAKDPKSGLSITLAPPALYYGLFTIPETAAFPSAPFR